MAYKVKDYGNGSLGDVNSISATINSYARVTAISTSTITINSSTQITGTATFEVGAKVLIHVSATTESRYIDYLGNYLLANVTAVNGDVLTLDEDPTTCIPADKLPTKYYVQAIAVAQYKTLKLESGTTISPPTYSITDYVGGIVAIMCSESLTFNGGHIDLTNKGIPTANKTLRPQTGQEKYGTDDVDPYSGWENSETQYYFMLNVGDGAAFIITKKMKCSSVSRIGNLATRGYQFYRGATNSVTYNETAPTDVTNVGGSTILIAAETIVSFTPYMFAKYRSKSYSTGQGLARCYIASETKLRNDEGLYAYDCVSNKSRIREMNIKNFGNGSFGDLNNCTTQLNNYATVTAIDGNKITYKDKTTTGLAQIKAGALVMIHFNQKSSSTITNAGRFFLANVLTDNGTVLTLDFAPTNYGVSSYAVQIVSIPQAENFFHTNSYMWNEATPAYNGVQGGILALAVRNACTLGNAVLKPTDNENVSGANRGVGYGRNGLAVIGNAQDSNKLPIGTGIGSVFLLAQNLTMTTSTRFGKGSEAYNIRAGQLYNLENCPGGYRGAMPKTKTTSIFFGSGANGGYCTNAFYCGGYGSSGGYQTKNTEHMNNQGAHVMVIANKITGFSLQCLSTGGYLSGEAGYGSIGNRAGGYNGGGGYETESPMQGGGSSGWAFVYCNEAIDQQAGYNGIIASHESY